MDKTWLGVGFAGVVEHYHARDVAVQNVIVEPEAAALSVPREGAEAAREVEAALRAKAEPPSPPAV
jgi:hypothetical protein